MPTRLIIGAETSSAAVFLQTMDTEYDTVVVGEDGLWAKLPDHPMGQPSHLLHLPGPPVPSEKGDEEKGERFISAPFLQNKSVPFLQATSQ